MVGDSDVTLLEGSQADGYLSFKFSRPLRPGDALDQEIGDSPLYLIWAVSDGDYETIHTVYGPWTCPLF